jgi:hypothetical protein
VLVVEQRDQPSKAAAALMLDDRFLEVAAGAEQHGSGAKRETRRIVERWPCVSAENAS